MSPHRFFVAVVAFVGVPPNLALPTHVCAIGAFGKLSCGWDMMDSGSPFVTTDNFASTETFQMGGYLLLGSIFGYGVDAVASICYGGVDASGSFES